VCDDSDDIDEDWDGEGDDADTDQDTVSCPACGADMYEDSPRCPRCGEYVTASGDGQAAWPPWIVATAVLCLVIAVLAWLIPGGLW
jgi:uncharacterized paraquat-inducible protein A